jgi:hypothetical protein
MKNARVTMITPVTAPETRNGVACFTLLALAPLRGSAVVRNAFWVLTSLSLQRGHGPIWRGHPFLRGRPLPSVFLVAAFVSKQAGASFAGKRLPLLTLLEERGPSL